MPLALPSDQPPPQSHVPALDAVRGLAILVVTCYRFRETAGEDAITQATRVVLDRGHHGVDLFFALSGFLITGILFDAKGRESYFRRFYWRRAVRIFPLYYAALVLGLVILPALLPAKSSALSTPPADSAWLWFFGSNLVQSWRNEWCLGPFNHFWSLAVEEHFYLFWPLVMYVFSRQQAMRTCVACIGMGLVSRYIAILNFNSPVAAETFTLCRIDAIGVGCWLALAMRSPGGPERLSLLWRPVAVGMVCLLAPLFVLGRLVGSADSWERDLIAAFAFTPFAILSGAVVTSAVASSPTSLVGRFWDSSLLRLAGKYSYGWYVFQGMIAPDIDRYLAKGLLAETDLPSLVAMGANILAGGGISLILAILSWHFFESPLLRLKERV